MVAFCERAFQKSSFFEVHTTLSEAEKNLEDLKKSGGSERDIFRAQAKVRTLEGDKAKAKNKYFKGFQEERDKFSLEQDIQALEDIEEEDLLQEEENVISESLKSIRRTKEALGWRKKIQLNKSLDPDLSPEQRKNAQKKLFQIKENYAKLDAEEKTFGKKHLVKNILL